MATGTVADERKERKRELETARKELDAAMAKYAAAEVAAASEVSSAIAESLLPAMRSYSAWRERRDGHVALVAFADRVCVAAGLNDPPGAEVGEPPGDDDGGLDLETVAGAAVLGWFVALGDSCDATPQTEASYLQACDRLISAFKRIETGGRVVQWIQFQALSGRNAMEWNAIQFLRTLVDRYGLENQQVAGQLSKSPFAAEIERIQAEVHELKQRIEVADKGLRSVMAPVSKSLPEVDMTPKTLRVCFYLSERKGNRQFALTKGSDSGTDECRAEGDKACGQHVMVVARCRR